MKTSMCYRLQILKESEIANLYPSVVTSPGSIDCLRHRRMFSSVVKPLLRQFPKSSWLTVGDGRYGSDSIYLKQLGAFSVHTTSLTDQSLVVAKAKDWIDAYSAENAESLSFPDDTFDFVLCKESYHHFPRPAIAFYEMLRVARIAVVLIEPNREKSSPLGFLKTIFKRLSGRAHYKEYEPSGNYIFKLDAEEIFHMARAIDLPHIVEGYFNDFYHPKLFVEVHATTLELFLFKTGVFVQDLLCKLKLLAPGGLSCAVFKNELEYSAIDALKKSKLNVKKLGRNPYMYWEADE